MVLNFKIPDYFCPGTYQFTRCKYDHLHHHRLLYGRFCFQIGQGNDETTALPQLRFHPDGAVHFF